jgi:deoxyadenosine/deoxycytidine kinase
MRVELAGGLGIGKSTLCRSLETIGFNCIYENLATNPFLDDCFKNPRDFRFPSQMWFTLSKYHEIKKYERSDLINVLDQAVLNVRAYTRLLFRQEDAEALGILNQCFDYLEGKLGRPDLLVHLKCSPHAQLRRIRGRNRDHEKAVSISYVDELQREIAMLVTQAQLEGTPVLTIDTEEVYLPDNLPYAEELARRIAGLVYQPNQTIGRRRIVASNDKSALRQYVEMADAI